jgi:hypothetical protein
MCWSLRTFLRDLHRQGLNPRALADCVPSMRSWKLANLPTFLPAAQVKKHSMVAIGPPLWAGRSVLRYAACLGGDRKRFRCGVAVGKEPCRMG